MADPLITEVEARRALDGLNPHNGAGPNGLFPTVLSALNFHIAPYLLECFTCHSKMPRSLKIGAVQQ